MRRADVRLETEEARVLYNDAEQTPETLTVAIDRLGFQASVLSVKAAPKPTLYIDGLTDTKAVQRVERVLRGLKGVSGVTVDRKDGRVFIEYETQVVSPRDLLTALEAAGFAARLGSP